MGLQQTSSAAEADERFAALITNSNAVRVVTAAVEKTIGPKGLDTMLIDRAGDVIITNDGVTILDKMEVNHPAARMLIHVAKAQQAEVGDGTTTVTLLAGALVSEGVAQVMRGVPVMRVIEGIKAGVAEALQQLAQHSRAIDDLDDALLSSVAMVAGREHADIAELVVAGARLVGREKLAEAAFKLSGIITAQEGAQNEVFEGVVINKSRMSREMPKRFDNVKIMVIDDALEPEIVEASALGTEAGFTRYLEFQQEFKMNIQKIIELGIHMVLVDRGVHSIAEEMLTDAGILVVQRVPEHELGRTAEHIGARLLKRTGLKKPLDELVSYIGQAEKVYEDEKLGHIRVLGGQGKPMATIVVGAATREVVGERLRIAQDAAASVQAAVCGGYVPGGGALEVALARAIKPARDRLSGMSAYGFDCVTQALLRPLSQIIENAGYNPLEKIETVIAAQKAAGSDSLAIDCDSGAVADMLALAVIDPAPVKRHALRAAGEVATAILRIDTIIKKRDDGPDLRPAER